MYDYRLGFLLLVGVYLISPMMLDGWLDASSAWYSPYVLWFLTVLTFIFLNGTQRQDDDL